MVDTTALTGNLGQWAGSLLLWGGILLGMSVFLVVVFVLRKRRKLSYICLELVRHGDREKPSFNTVPCGWFGKYKGFLKLWDHGPEQMELKTHEIIVGVSTDDYFEINGKRGVFAFRDPLNQNVLVPIHKAELEQKGNLIVVNGVKIKNTELLAEITPQEFRDVAEQLMHDADSETEDRTTKLIMIAVIGIIAIVCLILILVIINYAKNAQDKAAQEITDAGTACLKNAQTICGQIASNFAQAKSGVTPVPASNAP